MTSVTPGEESLSEGGKGDGKWAFSSFPQDVGHLLLVEKDQLNLESLWTLSKLNDYDWYYTKRARHYHGVRKPRPQKCVEDRR